MDAITDPAVEQVTVMKSARVGYSKILNHVIGYHIHQDPAPIMLVQPTIEDAQGYSKEEIAPMLRDTPVLKGLVSEAKAKDGANTILQKQFPGGTLSLVGANSPRGFRRVSRRIVLFDEVDGYPPSAGSEGDQIKLGIRRTQYPEPKDTLAHSDSQGLQSDREDVPPVRHEAVLRSVPALWSYAVSALGADQMARRRHVDCLL